MSATAELAPSAVDPIYQDRLDFTLPDFTRWSWVSDRARDVWEPRIHRITRAWLQIEWLSVTAGVRACGVTIATPEQFIQQAPAWAEQGLNALPVEMVGVSGQPYASTTVPQQAAKPFAFRLVLGAPADVAAFKRAWDESDDRRIGELLGYPTCCREFFRQIWVEQSLLDTTWPMAMNSATDHRGITTIELSGAPEANILWRWIGVRAVPHLPCRFDCARSVELAQRMLAVGRDAGYSQEVDWLLAMLDWPVEWSALHGIAEIKTPLLKISTRTDATAGKYSVRRAGTGYPLEGGLGLGFPWVRLDHVPLTQSRAISAA
jgi:hypothetical protein